ncbi:MAG: hypothetical protein OER98_06215 [Gammaproteobacteria bacterium]|nr:hypothetical protein [Gammaproteobacteria bacterium]
MLVGARSNEICFQLVMRAINTRYLHGLLVCLYTLGVVGIVASGGGSGGGGGNDPPPSTMVPFEADLPFNYSFGMRTLNVITPGGQTIYVSVGSFGAHFIPMSGDLLGDFKSNLIGLFAYNRNELAELPGTGGNDNGICDSGESCAFWGGLSGERIESRIPVYIAPDDGMLTRVTLLASPGPGYFGNPPHWEIQTQFNEQFSMRIGHLARISTSLRDKILAATGIDTDVYTGPTGAIVTDGTIAFSTGEPLAEPQVFANETAQPGYYIGGGTVPGVPWAQMEFTIGDNQAGSDVCVYDLLAPADSDAIQLIMENDMLDPMSPRFAPYAASQWIWRAEGVLCPVYTDDWLDYSSIHGRVGGWTERPESGTVVDELFAIVKIEKTSAAYDAALYSSSTVDHLVARFRSGALFDNWIMPDSTSATTNYAVGEVLEETDNSLLIMWRQIGWTGPLYQRAAFLLDSNGLKIKWGNFAEMADSALPPALAADEACDDDAVICYDHQARL